GFPQRAVDRSRGAGAGLLAALLELVAAGWLDARIVAVGSVLHTGLERRHELIGRAHVRRLQAGAQGRRDSADRVAPAHREDAARAASRAPTRRRPAACRWRTRRSPGPRAAG